MCAVDIRLSVFNFHHNYISPLDVSTVLILYMLVREVGFRHLYIYFFYFVTVSLYFPYLFFQYLSR